MAIPIAEVISHWSHFFQSFTMASDEFYAVVQKTIASQEMPDTKIERVNQKEGGFLSANREYLRIQYRKLVFDVCAAPFGKNFFISWWLYETEGTLASLLKNTKAGDIFTARAQSLTFYQADVEAMFRSCVHECILEAVAKVTEGKGTSELTAEDKAYKMGGLGA